MNRPTTQRLSFVMLAILVSFAVIATTGHAQTYQVAADEEFEAPTPVAWGIGKNAVRLTGATAVSRFDEALRVSLQLQMEYLISDRFGVRLIGDIPVYADSSTSVYQIYWDNVIHLLPYRRFDPFLGLGTGLSFLKPSGDDLVLSPLLTGLAGLNVHIRYPWSLGVEARAVWSSETFDEQTDWMFSAVVQAGVAF